MKGDPANNPVHPVNPVKNLNRQDQHDLQDTINLSQSKHLTKQALT